MNALSDEIWVNISSANGLLPDGTKPLPEPILTYHQRDALAFSSQDNIYWNTQANNPHVIKNLHTYISYSHISQGTMP